MGLLDRIGNTPLFQYDGSKGNILFTKLEGENPSGSIKDRLVAYLIRKAEGEGKLRCDQTLVEVSTGSTGVSLAMVARERGYKAEVLLPPFVRKEAIDAIASYGGNPIVSTLSYPEALALAARKEREDGYFWLNQHGFKETERCYGPLVEEVIQELRSQHIDCVVAAVGTGGTLTGVGRALKGKESSVHVVAVESDKSDPIFGVWNSEGQHDFYALPPDRIVRVTNTQALHSLDKLREQGIDATPSSGAVLYAAYELSQAATRKNFLLISADGKRAAR